MILDAFKKDQYYYHYHPLVYFLFATGCRFGESVGLRWKNVADDLSYFFICEVISRGEYRNQTKTGKSRSVVLSPAISAMLKLHSEQPHKPDDLVFASPQGRKLPA
jgi:integrase